MDLDLREVFDIPQEKNEKVFLKLLEAVKNNAQKEMDYLKFKKSYTSLRKLGMDENTAAKSALVTAETMGFSKDKLVQSVSYYQNVLKKEKEAFALALKNQITNNVESKQVEIDKLHTHKLETIHKIEKLKEELQLIDVKVRELEQAVVSSSTKIEETRQHFVSTMNLFEKELERDTELFNRIIL